MIDKEKVIKGMEQFRSDLKPFCGNKADWGRFDAGLAMLKEQEAVEPTINEYGEAYCICGENVGIIPSSKNLPSIRSKYCSECGRRMKWRTNS